MFCAAPSPCCSSPRRGLGDDVLLQGVQLLTRGDSRWEGNFCRMQRAESKLTQEGNDDNHFLEPPFWGRSYDQLAAGI